MLTYVFGHVKQMLREFGRSPSGRAIRYNLLLVPHKSISAAVPNASIQVNRERHISISVPPEPGSLLPPERRLKIEISGSPNFQIKFTLK